MDILKDDLVHTYITYEQENKIKGGREVGGLFGDDIVYGRPLCYFIILKNDKYNFNIVDNYF